MVLAVLVGIVAGCDEGVRRDSDIDKISKIHRLKDNRDNFINAEFIVYFFEVNANKFSLISESMAESSYPEMKSAVPEIFSKLIPKSMAPCKTTTSTFQLAQTPPADAALRPTLTAPPR